MTATNALAKLFIVVLSVLPHLIELSRQRIPDQDSNLRTLAFYTVILKIKEWQNISLTSLAGWRRVKNGVNN
jgi:uncharacterized membrane protein